VLNTVNTVKKLTDIHVLTIGNNYPYTLSCFGGHVVYLVVWL